MKTLYLISGPMGVGKTTKLYHFLLFAMKVPCGKGLREMCSKGSAPGMW